MPPDGYDTVTLPEDLVQRIDELAEDFHVDSRVAVLRSLIAEHKESGEIDDDLADTIEELRNDLSMAADPVVQPDVADLMDKVDTLADAVQEATNAAQRAEKKVDELQGPQR